MLVSHSRLCTITKYSHFFSVTNIDPILHKHLMDFCLQFVIRTLTRVDPKKPPVMKITTIFASRLKNMSEYRFHIGQLNLLLNFLKYRYIETELIEIIEKPLYPLITINNKLKDGWVLREEQQEAEQFVLQSSPDDNNSRLLYMPTGTGKAQPLDAPIKIPGGWTTMGEVKLGDTITAWDGEPTVVNGVFPQGLKDIYRITFSDGRTAECCEDHLWFIHGDYCNGRYSEVINTKQLLRIKETTTDKLYIPLIKPKQSKDIELPSDPYILGVNLVISESSDDNIIPRIYFNSSLTQRLSILQGILDTDGRLNDDGSISFHSENLKIAKTVQELVRSIGGIAKIITNKIWFHYSCKLKSDKLTFNVKIRYSKPSILFRKRIIDNYFDQYSTNLKLRVEKIEKIGKKEAQCISIDHPDKLYVTNDYVVTHNTVTGLSAASKYKNRVLIFILAKYVDKWISDVKQIIDIKDKEILTIQGSDNLRSSIFLAKDNEFSYNYVIITLDTMANFIKSYENNYYECLDMYGIDPSELCELFNIGVVLVDEAHQHLFKVFKTLSFVHAPKVIALSGTFLSNDPMIDRMQSIMFPKDIRFSKIKMKKYIKTLCVSYQIKDYNKSKIRTSEFRSSTYSHTAFEKSLIRNHVKLKTYFNMIKDLVNSIYIKNYIKGDKVLIFCSTKILCRKLKDYLLNIFTGYDIRTYIEEDPYENIIQADISISTLGSAGTALDIPNLRVVINTVNVDSITTNLQALGRLRELKDRDVKYCYIYCSGIPKHVKYHERRKELFKNSVLCLSDLHYPQPI